MAKAVSSNQNNVPSFKAAPNRPRWVIAILAFIFALLLAAALIDYSPQQSYEVTTNPTEDNMVGFVGAEISYYAFRILGVGAFFLPFFLFVISFYAIRYAKGLSLSRFGAMLLFLVTGVSLAAMFETAFAGSQVMISGAGGVVGQLIYLELLKETLGVFGTALSMGVLYVASLFFILMPDPIGDLDRQARALKAKYIEWKRVRREEAALRKEAKILEKQRKEEEKRLKEEEAFAAKRAAEEEALRKAEEKPPVIVVGGRTAEKPAPAAPAPKPAPAKAASPSPASKSASGADTGGLNIVKAEATKKARPEALVHEDGNYKFPPVTMLIEHEGPTAENLEEEHRENAENLLRILSEFDVKVTLGEIHVGPVITRYEVAPAPGQRVNKIETLEKDIALGMSAQSVRILAPIPGKAAVGIEVPNRVPSPVGLREIIESEDWVKSKAELPIALGKDVAGKPLISDLTKMPHLLIAGATGSGKSVCINSIVASILFSKSPSQVRLLMVDPKVVELKVFNTLPHMLIPVVTEPKKVPGALKWLLGEMEQRYQLFAKCNVRNIVGFNNRKKEGAFAPPVGNEQEILGLMEDEEIEIPEKLPYIVAIIDELADLMMQAQKEVEGGIARLAQLARAAGIHLIIATQRPSVNVITGVIKANLPSRIAFQVASVVDSKTILDGKGADTLIGRGDMLFSPPGSSRLVRAQGAFMSDEEVVEVVEFLKQNGPPQYAQSVQEQIDRAAEEDEEDEDSDGGDLGDDEKLFRDALDVIRRTGRASTSMIQRKLRIGYNRAARIIDLMEDRGIVGPDNGSSPREILKDLDDL